MAATLSDPGERGTLRERTRDGEQAALEDVLKQCAPAAYCAAYAVLAQREDALDAAQAALMRLARELGAGKAPGELTGRVYAYAHSAAVDLLRARSSRRRHERQMAAIGAEMSMDNALERDEALEALREELAQLPAETAALLAQFHLDELPLAEIARTAKLSTEACKKRIQRAREHLRERLERRGIALTLALAAIPLLYSSARAAAAEINPQDFARIAHAALPPGSPARPLQETARMSKAVALAALIFMLIGLLILNIQPSPMHATSPLPQLGTKSVESPALPAGPQRIDSPPHWQAARCIGENMIPGSMAVNGDHVILFVSRTKVVPDDPQIIGMVESTDCGQTWGTVKWLPPSIHNFGNAILNADGTVAMLASYTRPETANEFSTHFDWVSIAPTGSVNVTRMPWVFERDDFTYGRECLLQVNGGTWSFASRGSHRSLSEMPEILAARGTGTGCPAAIPVPIRGGSWSDHAAWARDLTTAGIFVYQTLEPDPTSALVHVTTRDGGKSWQTQRVPVTLDAGSNTAVTPYPVSVVVHDDVLQLLVIVRTQTDSIGGQQDQLYLMRSTDLGSTWSAPLAVGDPMREHVFLCGSRVPSLQSVGDVLLVPTAPCQKSTMAIKDRKRTVYGSAYQTVVERSADGGLTWQADDMFSGVPKGPVFGIVGCDGASLHLATYVSGKPSILVRSFARGEWPLPQFPAWYTEPPRAPQPTTGHEF